jgi:hypothetical protein
MIRPMRDGFVDSVVVGASELTSAATERREFAADLLKVQRYAIKGSIYDCNSRHQGRRLGLGS